tara:strand:+ start:505 stop:1494 length:990 start_codon:yes stop_codon:yes gene_type:complete
MIITRTPFRVSFFGGGTDLKSFYKKSSGQVLSAAIDKYLYVVVKKKLGIVEYKYRVNWSTVEFTNKISNIKNPVARECLRYFNINYPIEITTFADIPANTGLGSSSAFTVGLVNALYALQGKKVSKKKIATTAAKIEIDMIGRKIGKQDHFACCYGGLNIFKFYGNETVKVLPLNILKKNINKLEKNIILFYTKIKRNSHKVLKVQQNINKLQFNSLNEMKNLVDESKKIILGKKIDMMSFGSLLNISWNRKKKVNKNSSNKIIDKFYDKALYSGAYGGKLLGAGSGGFLMFIANKKIQKKIIKNLSKLNYLNLKFDYSGTKVTYNSKQ